MHKRTRWTFGAIGSLAVLIACGSLRRTREEPAPPRVVSPPKPAGLYGAEEALRDALSGPLTYLGTGPWPGSNRMHACAFRNARVVVVNVYCGLRDVQAFRVDVYSPIRGRARIYAESRAPVSARRRSEYFTFTVESEPPPRPPARVPPFHLRMSFSELHAYEEQRYAAYLPSCYGGTERNEERGGCLGALAPEVSAWSAQNRAFLAQANDNWYRIVRELRALASRHGRDPT